MRRELCIALVLVGVVMGVFWLTGRTPPEGANRLRSVFDAADEEDPVAGGLLLSPQAAPPPASRSVLFGPDSGVLQQISQEYESLLTRLAPSTVEIEAAGRDAEAGAWGRGSGFFISSAGHILTALDIVHGADWVRVRTRSGSLHHGVILGGDPLTGLAVVKIEVGETPAIRWGDSTGLRAGAQVLLAGYVHGEGAVAGIAMIAGRRISPVLDETATYEEWLRVDSASFPPQSGAAVANLNGQLLGITLSNGPRDGLPRTMVVVPSRIAGPVAETLMRGGVMGRAYLGIAGQTVDRSMALALGMVETGGVLISGVRPGSPAEAAGLQPGDVILSYGGLRAANHRELRSLISQSPIGQRVELGVRRAGADRVFTATVAALPLARPMINDGREELPVLVSLLDALVPGPPVAEGGDISNRSGLPLLHIRAEAALFSIPVNPGDHILQVEDIVLTGVEHYQELVAELSERDSVRVLIDDGGNPRFLIITRLP